MCRLVADADCTETLNVSATFVSVLFSDHFLFTHQGSDWTLDIMPLIVALPHPAGDGSLDAALAAALIPRFWRPSARNSLKS